MNTTTVNNYFAAIAEAEAAFTAEAQELTWLSPELMVEDTPVRELVSA